MATYIIESTGEKIIGGDAVNAVLRDLKARGIPARRVQNYVRVEDVAHERVLVVRDETTGKRFRVSVEIKRPGPRLWTIPQIGRVA